jgi:hypothetical protein
MALRPTREKLALAFLLVFAFSLLPSVNALPLFSNGTGPTDIEITDLDRIDAGCRDDVGDYASSRNGPDGTFEMTTFVETGSRGANLSAWAERTSPLGTDYSTFRVYVESDPAGSTNESCEVGIQYHLEYQVSGGSDDGLLADASGYSIVHVENGDYHGCTSSGSGRFADGGCPMRPYDHPPRTWANATGTPTSG